MNCDHAGPWAAHPSTHTDASYQWHRQDFVTGGSEVWVYRGSRVRSPPVPLVLSVYRRGSLLDGLAMYLSCDTKKFHDNESTHILHNFWTSTHRGKLPPPYPLAAPLLRTPLLFSGLRRFVWRCQSRVELVRRDWLCEYWTLQKKTQVTFTLFLF